MKELPTAGHLYLFTQGTCVHELNKRIKDSGVMFYASLNSQTRMIRHRWKDTDFRFPRTKKHPKGSPYLVGMYDKITEGHYFNILQFLRYNPDKTFEQLNYNEDKLEHLHRLGWFQKRFADAWMLSDMKEEKEGRIF